MASFSITGSFLTSRSRDLVLDGRWDDALEFLVSSLEGMTYEIAISILKGTHRLSGADSSLELVTDSDELYLEEVKDIYFADLVFSENKYYKVEGVIDQRDVQQDVIDKQGDTSLDVLSYARYKMTPNDCTLLVVSYQKRERTLSRLKALVVREQPRTSIPLWMKHFSLPTPREYFDAKKEEVPASTPVPTAVPVTATPSSQTPEKEPRSDIMSSFDLQIALSDAQSMGFDSIESYTEHYRNAVLKAIEERKLNWVSRELNGKVYRFPLELAQAYAFRRTSLEVLAPKWAPVSPSGIKMDNDSALHTDLWLAMGLPLDHSAYNHTCSHTMAFNELLCLLIDEAKFTGDFVTLNACGLTSFTGKVVLPNSRKITSNDILVVPHAGMEFDLQAQKAGLVICAVGGKLAHLAVVGRERGIPLIRVDEADKRFSCDMWVSVDFNKESLVITEHAPHRKLS